MRFLPVVLWFCLGVLIILVVLLQALPANAHSGALDAWGCHYDRRGYHCHEGQFTGRQFGSKMEMIRQMQTRSPEKDKRTEEKTAAEKKELTIWDIDAKIEEHFRKLDEEREEKIQQARKEETAKQAPRTEEPSQAVKDTFPFLFVVKRSDIQLHASHDEYSKIIETLDAGQYLYPISQTVGRGEVWYMVRTADGKIGWVRVPGL